MRMKTVVIALGAAFGAAALLALAGGCDGPADVRASQTDVRADAPDDEGCLLCLLFSPDAEGDDD